MTSEQRLAFNRTDSGNAERLIYEYRKRLRYCPEHSSWYVWDNTRWDRDTGSTIARHFAILSARAYFNTMTYDPRWSSNEKALDFARRSENAKPIRATLECAQTIPGAVIHATDFDRNPWLLNCINGTVNLQTGELQRHSPDDHITKTTHVPYHPDAAAPRWMRFLEELFPEIEKRTYVQLAAGYALTGGVSEKVMFCFIGNGNNGKSTMLAALQHVWGDYAGQMMIESLLRAQRHANTSADLGDLHGKRLVVTSEPSSDAYLDEARIKSLISPGPIRTVRKYENPVTFEPTHKLFMDANVLPAISDSSDAVWDRFRVVRFPRRFDRTQIDRELLERLKYEASGILRWAVEGCLIWQQTGLVEPDQVRLDAIEWQASLDAYGDFFDDYLFDRTLLYPCNDVRRAYVAYCQVRGVEPVNKRQFAAKLRELGCQHDRANQQRVWRGIGPKP